MQTAVEDRLTLELDLRGALERGEYYLVYQPIFELESGRVLGVEALLRWNHPVRGSVQPDAFIPLLEETKLIVDVGRWVIDEAVPPGAGMAARASAACTCRSTSPPASSTAITSCATCSPRSSATGLDAVGPRDRAHRDRDHVRRRPRPRASSRAIKELGVGIAIDDFGTGYSSLAYLRQFPVDILKIDRSFVSAISDSAESSALIRTLVQLGKQLGLKTLAEGIEEHDQFCQLQQEQCDSGQGFMFARPLAADAVEQFLAELPRPALPLTTTASTSTSAATPAPSDAELVRRRYRSIRGLGGRAAAPTGRRRPARTPRSPARRTAGAGQPARSARCRSRGTGRRADWS